MEWSDKFILNIEAIDKQHRGFFELFHLELNADENNNEKMIHVIEKLEKYVKNHFTFEESLLRKANYSDIDAHIAQHKFFIQKVNEMKQELKYSNPLLFEKITVFMKKWFLSHIMLSDKKFKEVVSGIIKK